MTIDRFSANGLDPQEMKRMVRELEKSEQQDHSIPHEGSGASPGLPGIYTCDDGNMIQRSHKCDYSVQLGMSTIDELLERDRQREMDGFPRKIRVGRLFKPGKGANDSVVIVPTTVEEKLLHDSVNESQESEAGGSGKGEEGEVIGEQQVRPEQGEGNGPGDGQGGSHEMESSAYDLGRILTEQFELPNLKDRGTKRALAKFTYDITDKNRGFGQVLDKKATIKKVIETNIGLGRIADPCSDLDTTQFLVSPRDKIYRVLSQEKDYESQAMVFFVRDYSGSMAGKCTELVVAQHVLIYSWLLYQYARRIETRFIVHDTEAKEVPDFYSYYNSKVAGGTQVSSAYSLVNQIVEKENLTQEYNIFVFQGTDGDDWDAIGEKAIPELRKILSYASRVGITIAEHGYSAGQKTEVQKYIEDSGLLTECSDLLRMDVVHEDSDETRLISGIRKLLSQEVLT